MVHPTDRDVFERIKYAIQEGVPLIMDNVTEKLDPSLNSVLERSPVRIGRTLVVAVGDQMCDYNEDFRLYMTTKLANPHYVPEVPSLLLHNLPCLCKAMVSDVCTCFTPYPLLMVGFS